MRRSLRLSPVLVAFLVLCGCAGKGDVTGTVRYKGQTMTRGTVMFQVGDTMPVFADIGPDGGYTLRGVPTGTARIAVNVIDDRVTEHFRTLSAHGRERQRVAEPDTPPASRAPDPGSFYIVPQRYAEVNTSGLSFKVNSGTNVHDIDID